MSVFNWIRDGNTYHLLVRINEQVFTTKFTCDNPRLVALNKQLKENNITEKVKKLTGVVLRET